MSGPYAQTTANTDALHGLEPELDRFPKEIKSQQFFVCRIILPEDAADVGIGKAWGSSRVAIQLLGCFSSLQKAKDYAGVVINIQDWANVAVFDMYEWITLPPEKTVREMRTAGPGEEGHDIDFVTHDPLLDQYCSALKKTSKDDAIITKMRVDMARKGKDGAQDLTTKDHAEWAKYQRFKQMYDIISDPEEYPAAMVTEARENWDEAPDDIKIKIIDSINSD